MAASAQPQSPFSDATKVPSENQDSPSKCPFSGSKLHSQDSEQSEPLVTPADSKVQGAPTPPTQGGVKGDPSFLQRGQVSHVFDGTDGLALFKILIPWRAVFGLGMLASYGASQLLPPVALLLAALLLLLPSLAVTLLRQWRVLPNPHVQDIVRGSMTDTMQGQEFCVFLLGARSNAALKLDQGFKGVGDAFVDMIKELERLPGSSGYLGGETYVGANVQRGSHVMTVTYWRSYEHLIRFTHNRSQMHVPAMKTFSNLYSTPNIGLWHEMYMVKPGQHESLYINCPPLGLGAVRGLVPATGKLASSKGRVAASAFPPPAAGSAQKAGT